jgi:hypothetical protein
MIQLIVAFLPLIVMVLCLRAMARQRLADAPHATPRRKTAADPPFPESTLPDADAEIPGWTALDDLQLERLLNDSS